MQPHQTRVRVRYAETDQMGVVYYANYLIWMEVARVEFCQAPGFRYKDMEIEDGVLIAVVEAQCRYLYPARFDDEVIIETRIAAASVWDVVDRPQELADNQLRVPDAARRGRSKSGHRVNAAHLL